MIRILRGTAALVILAAVVSGCSTPGASTPSPTAPDPAAARALACRDAAAALVKTVDETVAWYDTSDASASPVATPGDGTPTDAAASGSDNPSPDAAPAAPDLTAAVEAARTAITGNGCATAAFVAELKAGLAAIKPRGAIATAVLARVSATLTGRASQTADTRRVLPTDDLVQSLAEIGPGSTIELEAGTYALTSPLVLLDGITIKGAGRDRTVLSSSASGAAVLIVTSGRVELRDLALRLDAGTPASGILGGPTTSLLLSGVRVSGARATPESVGGAGIQLSGSRSGSAGTTLEVTDSAFDDNGWAGIAVAGDHKVSVLRAAFSRNGQCGLCFLDASTGSVEDSTFDGNMVGLGATGTSSPTWLRNTVTGGTVGVQVDGTAAPTIDTITITGSSRAAAIFSARSAGVITHATCKGVHYGIVVADTAAPTLGDNVCQVARGG